MTGGASKDAPGAEDVAAYVATMAQELKEMVEPYQLTSLGYLLDLVRLEAEQCMRDERNHDRFAGSGANGV